MQRPRRLYHPKISCSSCHSLPVRIAALVLLAAMQTAQVRELLQQWYHRFTLVFAAVPLSPADNSTQTRNRTRKEGSASTPPRITAQASSPAISTQPTVLDPPSEKITQYRQEVRRADDNSLINRLSRPDGGRHNEVYRNSCIFMSLFACWTPRYIFYIRLHIRSVYYLTDLWRNDSRDGGRGSSTAWTHQGKVIRRSGIRLVFY